MLFLRKEFWTDYFWLTDPWGERVYPELREPIRLPFTEKSGFQLELDEDCLFDYISLCLYHPEWKEPIEIGFDDQAHCHPYVFRWEELKRISHFLATHFPHCPEVPFLLLYRFAVITKEEDQDKAQKEVEAAWRSLGLFSDQEIEPFLEWAKDRWKAQQEDVFWVQHPEYGWVLDGAEFGVYSFRIAENKEFPFEVFNQLIQNLK